MTFPIFPDSLPEIRIITSSEQNFIDVTDNYKCPQKQFSFIIGTDTIKTDDINEIGIKYFKKTPASSNDYEQFKIFDKICTGSLISSIALIVLGMYINSSDVPVYYNYQSHLLVEIGFSIGLCIIPAHILSKIKLHDSIISYNEDRNKSIK